MKKLGALFLSLLFCISAVALAGTPTAAPSDKPCATAACGKCGDGYCAKQCGETAQSCPKDCGVVVERLACGKCGDGRCTVQCGETPQTCPKDCGVSSERLVADTKK